MPGPFFTIVDQLAKAPDGLAAIRLDPDLSIRFEALSRDQRTALLSSDWGQIQAQLVIEHPDIATLSDSPNIGWNLWKLMQKSADSTKPQA